MRRIFNFLLGICMGQDASYLICYISLVPPTLLSTNSVLLSNKLGTEGKVKMLPLPVDKTEPTSNSGSSRETSKVTASDDSSIGSSPTRVWDKIVLPTSSNEFRISITLALAYKYDSIDVKTYNKSVSPRNILSFTNLATSEIC